jgi:peptidoglycan/LPS O-acetylase OafA/YrhL
MTVETTTTPPGGVICAQARFGYIPGLDGIRACAVMMVLIAHIGFEHIIPGGFGVTVFFFISGFLITRLLLAELGETGRIDLPRFYIRRFLRLLPALYVMLILTGVLLIAMGDVPKLWETVAAFTWTMNYHYAVLAFTNELRVAPWEHLWSLAVEEHFYLIYPLVLVIFRRNLPLALKVSALICVTSLAQIAPVKRLCAHSGRLTTFSTSVGDALGVVGGDLPWPSPCRRFLAVRLLPFRAC